MSRKDRSFGQLISYMDSENSDRAYDLHHNCFSRSQEALSEEFYKHSLLLPKRKNGNILYHEIVSITLEAGVEKKYAKDCLRDIALEYIEKRCPRNKVYGSLHEDHENHLHYHLMISANELGEAKRFSLRQKEFQQIKEELETHVLQSYPELKQRKINTATREEKSISRKAAAQKRRTGKLERQEVVRAEVFKAMTHTSSLVEFTAKLAAAGCEFYTRGKHVGVKVSHDDGKQASYRFATLGVLEDFEAFNIRSQPSERLGKGVGAWIAHMTEFALPNQLRPLESRPAWRG